MVGKILSGSEPFGCANYCLNHDQARPLYWQGLDVSPLDVQRLAASDDAGRVSVAREMAHRIDESFRMQASMNPSVEKTVGHIALSFMKEDAPLLDDARMTEVALEYMEMMGYQDTQYLLVRHWSSSGNPHLHIFFNRVDNNGHRLNTWQDYKRNTLICRELTCKYGLHMSDGRANTHVERLHSSERVRYRISNAVDRHLPRCHSWKELGMALLIDGISMELVRRNDGTVQGVKFGMQSDEDGNMYEFTGSKVGRRYTYGHIDKALRTGLSLQEVVALENRPRSSEEPGTVCAPEHRHADSLVADIAATLLESTPCQPSSGRDISEEERRKKKKKKKHLHL